MGSKISPLEGDKPIYFPVNLIGAETEKNIQGAILSFQDNLESSFLDRKIAD